MTLSTETAPDLRAAFKDAMASWPSGVAIVVTRSGEAFYGTTIASFSSLSLDPLMVLFCLKRDARQADQIVEQQEYSISILSEGQSEVSSVFSRSSREATADLEGFATQALDASLPGVEGSVAIIQCRFVSRVNAGDHWIIVGEVTSLTVDNEAKPLVYFRRGYAGVAS